MLRPQKNRLATAFCFAGSAPDSNGESCGRIRAVRLKNQAARAKVFTLVAKRLLSRAALFLWKMPLSAMVSTTACILPNNSAALVLSPARTAFSTFFTAVRYLERSEVLAALILTSWRTRLRPDAKRGFFFLGFPDAINVFPSGLWMLPAKPTIIALQGVAAKLPA